MRYHHIRELVIEKKHEVRKVDIEMKIADNLTKLLPDHCFEALRRQMGLQKVEEHEGAESNEVAGEPKMVKFKE